MSLGINTAGGTEKGDRSETPVSFGYQSNTGSSLGRWPLAGKLKTPEQASVSESLKFRLATAALGPQDQCPRVGRTSGLGPTAGFLRVTTASAGNRNISALVASRHKPSEPQLLFSSSLRP